jgi:hypothetical protein
MCIGLWGSLAMGLLTIFLYFTKAKYSCLNRGVLKLRRDNYFEPATPLLILLLWDYNQVWRWQTCCLINLNLYIVIYKFALILVEKLVFVIHPLKSRNNLSWFSDKLSYNGNTSHRCEIRQTNVIFASYKVKIRAVVQGDLSTGGIWRDCVQHKCPRKELCLFCSKIPCFF